MAYPNYNYPAYGGYNPVTPYEPRGGMQQPIPYGQPPMTQQMGYGQPMQQPMMEMQQPVQMQQPMQQAQAQQPMQMQQPTAQTQPAMATIPQPLLNPQIRAVTSPEEANAVQVDFNGSPIIMPQILGNDYTAIYMKRWNMDKGCAEFKVFSSASATGSVMPGDEEPQQQRVDATAIISLDDLQNLQDLVDNMKKFIKEQQEEIRSLRKPASGRPAVKKGEESDAK